MQMQYKTTLNRVRGRLQAKFSNEIIKSILKHQLNIKLLLN